MNDSEKEGARPVNDGEFTWYEAPRDLSEHIGIAMVRPMNFALTNPLIGGTYVQLGPGNKMIRGYENLDFPEWDGDSMLLPYKDETVDGVVSYHTLDHLARPIYVLSEIQRILKPGGWFVNVVPHYDSELWHSDLTHKSQFGTETWRSIFSTRHYDHAAVDGHVEWKMSIEFNMIMGFTERNTVLVTQLVKGKGLE